MWTQLLNSDNDTVQYAIKYLACDQKKWRIACLVYDMKSETKRNIDKSKQNEQMSIRIQNAVKSPQRL